LAESEKGVKSLPVLQQLRRNDSTFSGISPTNCEAIPTMISSWRITRSRKTSTSWEVVGESRLESLLPDRVGSSIPSVLGFFWEYPGFFSLHVWTRFTSFARNSRPHVFLLRYFALFFPGCDYLTLGFAAVLLFMVVVSVRFERAMTIPAWTLLYLHRTPSDFVYCESMTDGTFTSKTNPGRSLPFRIY